MGHARAAGNCWNEIDFRASFSNLNYWPMHETLNSIHWKHLEDHIRKEAKQFKKVTVTTGAIFTKEGKVESKYIKGVYIPPAFFKLAAFEKDDGDLVIKSWIMRNDGSHQLLADSEVSVLLLERATRTKFFSKEILSSIDKECLREHRNVLRRQDQYLGIR
jgi:DNA/RNA endonuclease G (NUC1)